MRCTGDARASVVATSLRIITRLKKDWITTGRRPDGEPQQQLHLAFRVLSLSLSLSLLARAWASRLF
jgi:hypothetical protein